MSLSHLGWTPSYDQYLPADDGRVPGRVAVEHRGAYVVYTGDGEVTAPVSGRLRHDAEGRGELPAVGDWVLLNDGGVIDAILPRRTAVSRKAAGTGTEEQVLAANVDVIFLVTALTRDFNLRRLERFLATAWESGAEPVVVLSKGDLCADVDERVAEVESIALGIPVHVVSSVTGLGIDEVVGHLGPGRTAVLLGSSGVGKSTLINRLSEGEPQETAELRSDGRGRHTTTRRELVILPGGGLVIDTPGLRELQLWDADAGLGQTFEDIEQLAARCRFGDCAHEGEPGCAVRDAVPAERLESYRKLQRELRRLDLKENVRARALEHKKRKVLYRAYKRRDGG